MSDPRPTAVPGRIVWYFPNGSLPAQHFVDPLKPMTGQVTYVHEDGTVNLIAFAQDCSQVAFYVPGIRVPVLMEGEFKPEPPAPFATWMPFQVGQAKITAQASQQLNDLNKEAIATEAKRQLQAVLGPLDTFASTVDQRVVNSDNLMRHTYRVLSDAEKATVTELKDLGLALITRVRAVGHSRELDIAAQRCEEAIMWAVKHITA